MRDYYEFQQFYASMAQALGSIQGEMAPELFAPLADTFLKEYKQARVLFDVENNTKQALREAKFRAKLARKHWKARIRDEFKPSNDNFSVSAKTECSKTETLPSIVIKSQ